MDSLPMVQIEANKQVLFGVCWAEFCLKCNTVLSLAALKMYL